MDSNFKKLVESGAITDTAVLTSESLNLHNSSLYSIQVSFVKVVASAWVTATAYTIGQRVTESGTLYKCLVAHTSGVFATDLAAVKWVALVAGDAVLAGTYKIQVATGSLEADFKDLAGATGIITDVASASLPIHVFSDVPYRLARVVYTNTTGQGILQVSGLAKG